MKRPFFEKKRHISHRQTKHCSSEQGGSKNGAQQQDAPGRAKEPPPGRKYMANPAQKSGARRPPPEFSAFFAGIPQDMEISCYTVWEDGAGGCSIPMPFHGQDCLCPAAPLRTRR